MLADYQRVAKGAKAADDFWWRSNAGSFICSGKRIHRRSSSALTRTSGWNIPDIRRLMALSQTTAPADSWVEDIVSFTSTSQWELWSSQIIKPWEPGMRLRSVLIFWNFNWQKPNFSPVDENTGNSWNWHVSRYGLHLTTQRGKQLLRLGLSVTVSDEDDVYA